MSLHYFARVFRAQTKVASLLALLAVAPASAMAAGGVEATEFGIIAGKITDRRGAAQAGVPVSILSPGGRVVARATTQTTGRFSVPKLAPGIYSAEVVSPSFLPYLKTAIAVKAGGLALLDISLYKLAESVEFSIPSSIEQASEDWKWVLRAQHPTRPVLRFQQNGPDRSVAVSNGEAASIDPRERALHGTVKLLAGDDRAGFGHDSGLQTSFDMDYQLGANQSLGLTGSAGIKQGTPATSLHISWDRQDGDRATTHITATARQLFLPREYWVSQFGPDAPSGERVQSVTFGYAQERQITNAITAEFGSLLDSFSLNGQTFQLSPYGRVVYATPSGGLLTVSYAGIGPRAIPSGWDTQKQAAEQWLAIPQISAGVDGTPVMESGRHAEASWEQHWIDPVFATQMRTEASFFLDSLEDAALTIAFPRKASGAEVLPSGMLRDPFSNRQFISAGNYRSAGARAAISTEISPGVALIAAYSYAGSMVASTEAPVIESAQQLREVLRMQRSHSVALKIDSTMPGLRTHVITSYRWLPERAITVADPYNRGIGQADPYLSVYILQPLPSPNILQGQFEAIADFTNLLADGYLSVRSASGIQGTLFPAARAFRGGFNFVF
ncbi:MAG: carboxypeptidase regulatory-like domain-containing protein [Acidobacteria bacterium]|nr:carboxypeptidase regulatory-like domain-containing protein [Acidobacteriota bacterium]